RDHDRSDRRRIGVDRARESREKHRCAYDGYAEPAGEPPDQRHHELDEPERHPALVEQLSDEDEQRYRKQREDAYSAVDGAPDFGERKSGADKSRRGAEAHRDEDRRAGDDQHEKDD